MVSTTANRADRAAHRWVLLAVAATLVLIVVGGLVTSRGAGLAVPDWPLSYGTLNPPRWYEIENVRTEHGHRLAAALVTLLTLIAAWQVGRRERRRGVRLLATACVATVLVQALLGGLRVLRLSIDLAMVHGWLGQAFLCLLVALATVTSPHWFAPATPAPQRFTPLAVATLAAVVVQLGLGIAIRHGGDALRPLSGQSLFWGHLTMAAVILVLSVYLPMLAARADAVHGYLLRRSRLLRTLVVVQLMLGIAAWLTTDEPRAMQAPLGAAAAWAPTLHVVIGAAVLATCVPLILHAWLRGHEREGSRFAPQAAGVLR